jgi:hypothetical protein
VGARARRRRGKNTKRFVKRENKNGRKRGRELSFLVVKIKKVTQRLRKPKFCGETAGFIQVKENFGFRLLLEDVWFIGFAFFFFFFLYLSLSLHSGLSHYSHI